MKRVEVTRHQFKALVVVVLTLCVVVVAFGLPEVLPLFGVKKAFADLSSVLVCGMCYAVMRRWPSFVEYGLPEVARAGLRRLGCEVVYANDE